MKNGVAAASAARVESGTSLMGVGLTGTGTGTAGDTEEEFAAGAAAARDGSASTAASSAPAARPTRAVLWFALCRISAPFGSPTGLAERCPR